MSARLLAQACTTVNNANKSNKRQVLIRNINNLVLSFFIEMQKKNYINSLFLIKDKKVNKLVINLNGKLNKCSAISPNYDLKLEDLENFRNKVLPARQFGHLVMNTKKGLRDSSECVGKFGGKVIGYFY